MNAQPAIPKRRGRPPKVRTEIPQADKPKLGHLDPLEAAQAQAHNAMEGNLKLAKAVDILRAGLELIIVAEFDRETNAPTTTRDLRQLAANALTEYSALTGQSWRNPKNKLTGASRAGDKSLNFEE